MRFHLNDLFKTSLIWKNCIIFKMYVSRIFFYQKFKSRVLQNMLLKIVKIIDVKKKEEK